MPEAARGGSVRLGRKNRPPPPPPSAAGRAVPRRPPPQAPAPSPCPPPLPRAWLRSPPTPTIPSSGGERTWEGQLPDLDLDRCHLPSRRGGAGSASGGAADLPPTPPPPPMVVVEDEESSLPIGATRPTAAAPAIPTAAGLCRPGEGAGEATGPLPGQAATPGGASRRDYRHWWPPTSPHPSRRLGRWRRRRPPLSQVGVAPAPRGRPRRGLPLRRCASKKLVWRGSFFGGADDCAPRLWVWNGREEPHASPSLVERGIAARRLRLCLCNPKLLDLDP